MSLIITPTSAPNNVILNQVKGGLQVGPILLNWNQGQSTAMIDLTQVVRTSNFSAKTALIDNTSCLLPMTLTDSNQNNYTVPAGTQEFVPISWLAGGIFTVAVPPYFVGAPSPIFVTGSDIYYQSKITFFDYVIQPSVLQGTTIHSAIQSEGGVAPYSNMNGSAGTATGAKNFTTAQLGTDVYMLIGPPFAYGGAPASTLKHVTASLICEVVPTANVSGSIFITAGPTSQQYGGSVLFFNCLSTAVIGQPLLNALPISDLMLNNAQANGQGNGVYASMTAAGNTLSGATLKLSINCNQEIN